MPPHFHERRVPRLYILVNRKSNYVVEFSEEEFLERAKAEKIGFVSFGAIAEQNDGGSVPVWAFFEDGDASIQILVECHSGSGRSLGWEYSLFEVDPAADRHCHGAPQWPHERPPGVSRDVRASTNCCPSTASPRSCVTSLLARASAKARSPTSRPTVPGGWSRSRRSSVTWLPPPPWRASTRPACGPRLLETVLRLRRRPCPGQGPSAARTNLSVGGAGSGGGQGDDRPPAGIKEAVAIAHAAGLNALPPSEEERFLKTYECTVQAGYAHNPIAPTQGPKRRGRRKQS